MVEFERKITTDKRKYWVSVDEKNTVVLACADFYDELTINEAEKTAYEYTTIAAALLAAAKVARENEAKNGNQANYQADN